MSENQPVEKDVPPPKDSGNDSTHNVLLGSVTINDYRDAESSMFKPSSVAPQEFTLSGPGGLDSSGFKSRDSVPSYAKDKSGVTTDFQSLSRSNDQLRNVELVLTDSNSKSEDKLRAAGVLAGNGRTELKDKAGNEYQFKISSDNTVTLRELDDKGKERSISSGKISASGNDLLKLNAWDKNSQKGDSAGPDGGDTQNKQGTDNNKKPTGVDALFDPRLSQEDKLRAAKELADQGVKTFKGPDGKTYAIGTHHYGSRDAVAIFQADGKGHSNLLLRGIVDNHGNVSKQRDRHGHEVDYQSNWAKQHKDASPISRHDEKKPGEQDRKPGDQERKPRDDRKPGDQGDKPGDQIRKPGEGDKPGDQIRKPGEGEQKPGDQIRKHGEGDKPGDQIRKPGEGEQKPGDQIRKHGEGDKPGDQIRKPGEGDKPGDQIRKPGDQGTKPGDQKPGGDQGLEKPDEAKHLQDSRERLKKAAEDNISSPTERAKFLKDMEALEKRAQTQPLSQKEVADTYDQLSKLLEAKEGKVPKDQRVLAAETFAHHMADPTNIDQGQHNTCNVTSLQEHLMTRNPSKAAEIVATMAITGEWTAPDGKHIKIDAGSLVPGAEERNNPPRDNERSYATQLMNLALVNDVTQRRMPPEFYSQERPNGQGDLGERLRYADGKDVTKHDVLRDGDKTPYNSPRVHCEDITNAAQRLTGDTKFLIAHTQVDNSGNLVHINSPEDLAKALADLKSGGKMPAIIMVDVNKPPFGDNKDPNAKPAWHVISVTSYDEKTGKVGISNQWGKSNDITTSVDQLYGATTPTPKPKPRT